MYTCTRMVRKSMQRASLRLDLHTVEEMIRPTFNIFDDLNYGQSIY